MAKKDTASTYGDLTKKPCKKTITPKVGDVLEVPCGEARITEVFEDKTFKIVYTSDNRPSVVLWEYDETGRVRGVWK